MGTIQLYRMARSQGTAKKSPSIHGTTTRAETFTRAPWPRHQHGIAHLLGLVAKDETVSVVRSFFSRGGVKRGAARRATMQEEVERRKQEERGAQARPVATRDPV